MTARARGILSLVLGAGCAQGNYAADPPARWSELLRNSPFSSSNGPVVRPLELPVPLEFRGWVVESGSVSFSIYDAIARKSDWVQVGEQTVDFTVIGYDLAKQELSIDWQGKLRILKMKQTQIVATNPGASHEPFRALHQTRARRVLRNDDNYTNDERP